MANPQGKAAYVSYMQRCAEMAVIEHLGTLAKGVDATWCCGGAIVLDTLPVKIYYDLDNAESKLAVLHLPAETTEGVQQLASACDQASFGKGKVGVTDLSYRKALKLDTTRFGTTFDLSAHSILTDIAAVMVPEAYSVRAVPYKLNIYATGDHFKAHVDTPRSTDMFGSLVVCLPCEHTGGALTVSHEGETVRHDWGSSVAGAGEQGAPGIVHWAAFYSDCEHEINKVTSGYRITLTYNLYADPMPKDRPLSSKLDMAATALYQYLQEALANPGFLPDGGVLGFGCQHAYPHTDQDFCSRLTTMLKGADAVIYATAKQLGLDAEIRAIWNVEGMEYWDAASAEEESDVQPLVSSCQPVSDSGPFSGGDGDCVSEYKQLLEMGLKKIGPIEWCIDLQGEQGDHQPVHWCMDTPADKPYKLGMTGPAYGNDPSTSSYYCAAYLQVKVPVWGSHARGG